MENEHNISTAGMKLLEALSEPQNYRLSKTELCEKAGIGRNTYYTLLKNPEFLQARKEVTDKVFNSFVPDVKCAAIKAALKEKNFQDRKLILEMSGEYRPKRDIESININLDKNVSNLTNEDLEAEIEKLKGK